MDIGCVFSDSKSIDESVVGQWVGVEPFKLLWKIKACGQSLTFGDDEFDVAIMDAVLEYIPNFGKEFSELSEFLKQRCFYWLRCFYVCFQEIPYSHFSFKAIEHYRWNKWHEIRENFSW